MTVQDSRAALKSRYPLVETIRRYGVDLKKHGSEYKACCPFHAEKTPSFTVYEDGGEWRFHCHGCGADGDVINFIARAEGRDNNEVFAELLGNPELGHQVNSPAAIMTRSEPAYRPVLPVPSDAPQLIGPDGWTAQVFNPKVEEGKQRKAYLPAHVAAYRTSRGELLGYVIRLEWMDGGKVRKAPLPVTWCEFPDGHAEWCLVGFDKPKPVYRLETLAEALKEEREIAGLLWVEGEKKADAAALLIEPHGWIVLAWPNGAKSADKVDVAQVIELAPALPHTIWPDADDEGRLAAATLAHLLTAGGAPSVSTVMPPEGVSDGWDLADAEKEGWSGHQVVDHIGNSSTLADAPIIDQPAADQLVQVEEDDLFVGLDIPAGLQSNELDDIDRLVQSSAGDPASVFEPARIRILYDLRKIDGARYIRVFAQLRANRVPVRDLNRALHEVHKEIQRENRPTFKPKPLRDAEDYADNVLDEVAIRPLGVRDNIYYYLSWATGEVIPLKPNDHTKNQLKSLAPAEYWSAYYADEDGKMMWDDAVTDLMDACQKAGKFNPDRLRGLGAWLENDRVVIHLGDKLVINGRRVPLMAYDGKFVYQSQDPLPAPDLSQPLSDDEGQLINDICLALRWENRLSGFLMAGWIVSSMICGALPVRPHVWLTGAAGSGKTWFLANVLRPLLQWLALHVQSSSSEAGIRQTLGLDARPVLFDECEGEDDRSVARIQAVLELARGSFSESGGRIVKGTAGQMAKQYEIRSSFFFSSIGVSLKMQSDKTRCLVLSLASSPDAGLDPARFAEDQERFERMKQMAEVFDERYAARLFARTLKLVPVIRANATVFTKAAADVLGSQRLGDLVGTLLAGSYALSSEDLVTADQARAFLQGLDGLHEFVAEAKEKDEERVLGHLMSADARIDGADNMNATVTRTIGEVIRAASDSDDPQLTADAADRWLRRHGLKVGDGFLFIANSHTELSRIFAGTPWPLNWNNLLKRWPGRRTPNDPVRLTTGVLKRGIELPLPSVIGQE